MSAGAASSSAARTDTRISTPAHSTTKRTTAASWRRTIPRCKATSCRRFNAAVLLLRDGWPPQALCLRRSPGRRSCCSSAATAHALSAAGTAAMSTLLFFPPKQSSVYAAPMLTANNIPASPHCCMVLVRPAASLPRDYSFARDFLVLTII